MTSDTIFQVDLRRAFEAERADRATQVYGRESGFRYQGVIPYGVKEVGRSESWDIGLASPYVTFDGPLDIDLMRKAIYGVFGSQVKVDVWFEDERGEDNHLFRASRRTPGFWNRLVGSVEFPPLFSFQERGGSVQYASEKEGFLNYNGDTGPPDIQTRDLLIETIVRYLHFKDALETEMVRDACERSFKGK